MRFRLVVVDSISPALGHSSSNGVTSPIKSGLREFFDIYVSESVGRVIINTPLVENGRFENP